MRTALLGVLAREISQSDQLETDPFHIEYKLLEGAEMAEETMPMNLLEATSGVNSSSVPVGRGRENKKGTMGVE